MSGRQYSTAYHPPHWLLNFSACFPQCPREKFSIDFELLFPHPLQIFFLIKTFHENGAFSFSTLDRCTQNLNCLGNVAWRMRFIQVAADGGISSTVFLNIPGEYNTGRVFLSAVCILVILLQLSRGSQGNCIENRREKLFQLGWPLI